MTVKINYANINFDDLLNDLKQYLRDKNNFTDADFEGSNLSLLLELMAYTSTLLSYYTNASANESYIGTAELYESVNRLSELVGYFPQGFESSIVDTTMTLDLDASLTGTPWTSGEVLGGNWFVQIPAFSEWKAQNNTSDGEIILFTNPRQAGLLLTEQKNTDGELNVVVPLIQGVPKTHTLTSDGSVFQTVELDNPFIDHENITITVDGTAWTRKTNFYESITATSTAYVTRVNQDSKIEVQFGDNLFGLVPPLGSEIIITYVESLGSKGKVTTNQLGVGTASGYNGFQTDTYVFNQFNTGQQFLASWVVAQAGASSYGSDIETTTEIRKHAPWSFRIQGRVPTDQDYEDFLKLNYSDILVDVKAYSYEVAVSEGIIAATETDYFGSNVDQTSGWNYSTDSFTVTPAVSGTAGEIAIMAGLSLNDYNSDGTDFTFSNWAKLDASTTSGGTYLASRAVPNSYHHDEAVYVINSKIYSTSGVNFKYIVDGEEYPVNTKTFSAISPSTSGAYSDDAYVKTSTFICPVSGTGTSMAGRPANYGIKVPAGDTIYIDDLKLYQPIETSRYWFNDVFLYVVPSGTTIIDTDGNIVNQATIDKFEADLLGYKMLSLNHVWREPEYVTFNITIVYSKDPTLIFTSSAALSNEISQTISNYFDKSNRSIGDTISYSEIITQLKDIEGVQSIRLAITTDPTLPGEVLTGDIDLGDTQFPILGTTSISEGTV